MGRAKRLGKQTRELSSAHQLMIAVQQYCDDNKGRVLPGYAPDWMIAKKPPLDANGETLKTHVAQRYPWRLAPYMVDIGVLFTDQKVLSLLRSTQSEYSARGGDLSYVISLIPSLGMNSVFVGGSAQFGQFEDASGVPSAFQRVFGRMQLRSLEDARNPSKLMVFASARCEEQPGMSMFGRPEGYFQALPPRITNSTGMRWDAAYNANATFPGTNSGFVSLRHGGKAVTSRVDGHADLVGWTELNDMRMWADKADSPTWSASPGK